MSVLWLMSRSAGLLSVVLLSATVAMGIVSSSQFPRGRWSRWMRGQIHIRVAYLACAMLALHVAAIVLDSYVAVNALDAVVPFTSSYDRIGVGLAAISVDLVIIVVLTSLLRSRLPFLTWQRIHVLAYLAWPVAIIHGLVSGTDDLLTWTVSLVGSLTVALIALFRILPSAQPRRRPVPAGPASRRPTDSSGTTTSSARESAALVR
jgi:methionine sulfoxide reductase heme-binding subunit